jgi:hypothetical protein
VWKGGLDPVGPEWSSIAGFVTTVVKLEMCTECWPEYLMGGEHWEDLSVVVRITDLKEVG